MSKLVPAGAPTPAARHAAVTKQQAWEHSKEALRLQVVLVSDHPPSHFLERVCKGLLAVW